MSGDILELQPSTDPIKNWKQDFLNHYAQLGSITAAAKETGIDRTTIWYARKSDETFNDAIQGIDQWTTQRVEDTLAEKALEGGTTEMIFYLKCKKPEIYGDKLRADQIETIRKEARLQVLSELRSSVNELPEAARQALLAAVPS
jgi:glycogen debranching enzyme